MAAVTRRLFSTQASAKSTVLMPRSSVCFLISAAMSMDSGRHSVSSMRLSSRAAREPGSAASTFGYLAVSTPRASGLYDTTPRP